jgi:hypothetical protein
MNTEHKSIFLDRKATVALVAAMVQRLGNSVDITQHDFDLVSHLQLQEEHKDGCLVLSLIQPASAS